ncbi:aggregation-promoting factor [Ligilactobacillus salivarius]|uniref:Peptidoglycan-binding protein LysM n=1 Tax=Ligilactobacillus salivarius TaxID=1624 RepID=A0A1D7TS41_9LACO|nr:LysM domain-containing protein [Ligilactobacillus salivarius]AOO73775.1 peptidoglycan-binding protein LysM [Ligilactobacillus salivarius]MDF4191177.1 LysM domain-containing protein [Ligilactobacillus salivarius]UDE96643.1 LysM peptidoglycan-binding domain-containing protein [Ligilactobacillus salivarius]UUV95769.1 LysM peptidoglycan-binding domain-containing protein [Ligilactobacillus salivarius]
MKFNKALLSVTAAAGLLAVGTIAANADQVTVQPGDTVSKIAQEHNTTVDSIQQLNNLANVNLIYAGQTLEVGENGQATASANTTTTSTTTNNYQSPAQTYNYNYQAATTPSYSYNNYNYQAATTPSYSYNNNNNYSYNANTNTQAANSSYNYQASGSSSEEAAKAWIANKESGGSYTATNGQYIGKYQLSASYLNGDYSSANQERVANQYVTSRYGSWVAAQQFWQSHGWY